MYERKKLECYTGVIADILDLANTARQHGVLALEERAQLLESYSFQAGIMLVVDGTLPELVAEVLDTLIVFSGKTGVELLKQLIIKTGVLGIQAGENPRILQEKLVAFLGEDFILEHVVTGKM